MSKELIFYQLFEQESSTYTYLLADPESKEAVIIDPVLETINRDLKLIQELELKLKFVLDTHVHADHITAAALLRERTGAKTAIGKHSGVKCADRLLGEGNQIKFGKYIIEIIETPGHTNGCLTFKLENKLFTGDALLIRSNGRTDFQQGSAEKLYQSIHKLFNLEGDFTVYPGHDYKGQTKTTLSLEKKFNPRIGGGKSKEEFTQTMASLKLAHPKKMQQAIPSNLICGQRQDAQPISHEDTEKIPTGDNPINLKFST